MQAAKDMKKPRKSGIFAKIFGIPAVQTILASLLCVLGFMIVSIFAA